MLWHYFFSSSFSFCIRVDAHTHVSVCIDLERNKAYEFGCKGDRDGFSQRWTFTWCVYTLSGGASNPVPLLCFTPYQGSYKRSR